MNLTWIPRLLGLATAGYAAAVLTRPQILLRPTGIDADDPPAPAAATVARAVGARDLITGLAMAAAPAGGALRTAIAVRVACDLGDAALFAYALHGKPEQGKAIAVATGWGALSAASAMTVRDG